MSGTAPAAVVLPGGVRNVVVDAATGETVRWDELATPTLDRPTAALVLGPREAVGWVAAHVRTRTELLVAPASRVSADLAAELAGEGLRVVRTAPDGTSSTATAPTRPRDAEPDRLWLLTSGSTGRPRRVGHTLTSLTTVSSAPPPQRWLCPYPPGSYAWWQLVTLSLAHPGQDLVLLDPGRPEALDRWPAAALEHGVTAVSGTPTFWRRSMMTDPDGLARLPLRQVTLGGEPVDQAVLDQLGALFPRARVSWIYASSEVGASVVVHDGRAGFPVAWLGASGGRDERDAGRGRVGLEVDGEELVVRSPHRADGQAVAVRTGDRVEVVGDRVHVVGRIGLDEINVGGVKVSAGQVRAVLLGHPRVRWARVHGRRAPLVGTVVAAEVVLAPPTTTEGDQPDDAAGEQALRELTRWCAERLPEAAVPRRVRLLDEVPVKESLKTDVR